MRTFATTILLTLTYVMTVEAGGDFEKAIDIVEKFIHKVGDIIEEETGIDLDWKDDIDHILNEIEDETGIGITLGICTDGEGIFLCSPSAPERVGVIVTDDTQGAVSGHSPEVVVDNLSPITLTVGESTELDLSKVFTDKDGDPLTISAKTRHPEIFSVESSDDDSGKVRVMGNQPGSGNIAVTAEDPDGNGVLLIGKVDVVN